MELCPEKREWLQDFVLCNHMTFDWTVPQHVVSSTVFDLDVLEEMQKFTIIFSAFVVSTFLQINLVDSSMVVELS
jgi:hypothetical protein